MSRWKPHRSATFSGSAITIPDSTDLLMLICPVKQVVYRFTGRDGMGVGSVAGVALMVINKKDSQFAIPFGPFLAFGALVYLFWGPQLISWYLGLMVGG